MLAGAPPRKILHVDMDAYYASIEQRDRPELRGQPVIVGGRPGGRGVVAAASYEARRYGIRSAMPSSRAYRLCPHAKFVSGSFKKYREVSQQIRAIFDEVTDHVEPLSLDEAYLDVTENHLGESSATRVGRWIQNRIWKETKLSASVGISSLKFIAKVASDLKKPGGFVVIPPHRVDPFIRELPVEKIWSVGPVTAQKLREVGIHTAGEIRNWERDAFVERFGKHGRFLYELAHGRDARRVHTHHDRKSRGSESTFRKDICNKDRLLEILAQKVLEIVEAQKTGARTVTLKIRYSNFETFTRSQSLPFTTSDPDLVYSIAKKILLKQLTLDRRPVRLLGLSLSGFEESRQLWLPFYSMGQLLFRT